MELKAYEYICPEHGSIRVCIDKEDNYRCPFCHKWTKIEEKIHNILNKIFDASKV
jgi:hypothetical protein